MGFKGCQLLFNFSVVVLLDSDEEDDLLSFSKVAPTKKIMQTSKLTTAETLKSNKDVGRRKKHLSGEILFCLFLCRSLAFKTHSQCSLVFGFYISR